MQIFVNTNYDFVKYRFYAVAFSLAVILVGAFLFYKQGVNWVSTSPAARMSS